MVAAAVGGLSDDRPAAPADLMADPGELDVSCLDCHHDATMPVAALLPRYTPEMPFLEWRALFGL
jgi:hypothetical protein